MPSWLKFIVVGLALYLFATLVAQLAGSLDDSTTSTTGSEEPSTSPSVTNRSEPQAWYENGDLHKAHLKEWRQASRRNRLATAGDFVVEMRLEQGASKSQIDLEALKPKAEKLVTCISETAGEKSQQNVDSEDVSGIAALCMSMMWDFSP